MLNYVVWSIDLKLIWFQLVANAAWNLASNIYTFN